MDTWTHVNDDVVKSLIAVTAVAAAVLVLVGLVRASRGRLRHQLVIPDMSQADLVPAVVAGLSSLLRQEVRNVLNRPDAPDPASLAATVGKDIAGGVAALHCQVKDIPRLQLEVLAAPRDEIGMLAGGIRAMSPDRAEGLLGAFSAALPIQRGSIVQPMPQAREWGGLRQVGLTLDAGPIHRAHQASATFWSIGAASGSTGNAPNDRNQLIDLLKPAATWISIYLVAGSLPVRPSERHWFAKAFHPKNLVQFCDEVDALRAILAAQLATYEMFWYSAKPLVALGFSAQALYDAHRAMRLLDGYFRPHYIAGTIHEARGNALITLKDFVGDPRHASDTSLLDSYASQAAESFDKAREEFDHALTLLDRSDGAETGRAGELRLDFRVRSLKAALRGFHPGHALDQVPNEEINWNTLEQRYNVACLYAVASAVAGELGRDGHELARRSRIQLVAVLNQDPTLADTAESDPDLRSAFAPEELHSIAQGACAAATLKPSA